VSCLTNKCQEISKHLKICFSVYRQKCNDILLIITMKPIKVLLRKYIDLKISPPNSSYPLVFNSKLQDFQFKVKILMRILISLNFPLVMEHHLI
jgi:hypothetical protein